MDPQSLLLFFSDQQPRRIKVIENLLRGRKTVSTLYWGMRYQLLAYLGTLKSIDLINTQRSLVKLCQQNKLIKCSNNAYLVNPKLVQLKPDSLRHNLWVNLYYNVQRFKDRFLLAVQVVSEYSYHNVNYYPLQINLSDAQLVKQWFHNCKGNHLASRFFLILKKYLAGLAVQNQVLAWQAVTLLIGHRDSGKTLMQLSQILHQPVVSLEFQRLGILCGLITFILRCHDRLLNPLLRGIRINPVSSSAQLTFRLALNHLTLNQIAKRRHLKISTVKEHLLTVAILSHHEFPYRRFIPRKLRIELSQVYLGDIDRWQYNDFQMVTGHQVDFFYFRMYQIMRSKIDD